VAYRKRNQALSGRFCLCEWKASNHSDAVKYEPQLKKGFLKGV